LTKPVIQQAYVAKPTFFSSLLCFFLNLRERSFAETAADVNAGTQANCPINIAESAGSADQHDAANATSKLSDNY
jgi:hypothetical protein